jgi:hypothetical protein
MKAFAEIGDELYPLHTYLLSDDKSKMYGYKVDGRGAWQLMKSPYRFDSRRRKFQEVKISLPKITEPRAEKQVGGKTWQVKGSKGDTYTVTLNNNAFACSCTGFKFRSTCKHVDNIKETAS